MTKEAQSDADKTVEEIVIEPDHYARWAIEPIEFILRNEMDFASGNAVKYITRAGYKLYPGQTQEESEVTDLKKAMRYLEMRINLITGEEKL